MKIVGSRLLARALGLMMVALLASCGGSNNNNSTAQVRLLNASAAYSQLDFYNDGTVALSGVATNVVSDYVNVSAGVHTTTLTRTGSTSTVQSQSRTLAGDTAYTVIAYGWEGGLKTFTIPDNQAAPASGQTSVRIIDTATDAGPIDVYITGATDSLTDATAYFSGISGDQLSGFANIAQGTYRIRVTAYGKKDAILLDVPSVTLTSAGVTNFIITPGSSGVLVSLLTLEQKGAVTAYTNTLARVRLVAAVTGNATVTATAGSTALHSGSGSRSPLVGNYVAVPSGSLPLSITVNGAAVSAPNLTLTPGEDVTLIVGGTPAAPVVPAPIVDDNRLPTTTTSAKLRLVNAVTGEASGLSLVSNFSALVDGVEFGQASAYTTLSAGIQSEIDVTSPLTSTALFSITNATLLTDGVYTVFVMGDASAPAGVLRKDR